MLHKRISLPSPSALSGRNRHEDYALYRDRMEHEDTLIGQPINWLVSSQAFLLTPYVLCFLKPFDVLMASNPRHIQPWSISVTVAVIEITITLIGFRSCYRVGKSVAGAELAMERLTFAFKSIYRKDEGFEPNLSPSREESVKGISAPHGLIKTFTKAWSTLLCLSIASPLLMLRPEYACFLCIPVALLGLALGAHLCRLFYDDDRAEIEALNRKIVNLEQQ